MNVNFVTLDALRKEIGIDILIDENTLNYRLVTNK